jgi:hypothetical protein
MVEYGFIFYSVQLYTQLLQMMEIMQLMSLSQGKFSIKLLHLNIFKSMLWF